MRINRSIQAEDSFANLKTNMSFWSFLSFDRKAVYAEYYPPGVFLYGSALLSIFLSIGLNIAKG